LFQLHILLIAFGGEVASSPRGGNEQLWLDLERDGNGCSRDGGR
jgi:hypothetical protein